MGINTSLICLGIAFIFNAFSIRSLQKRIDTLETESQLRSYLQQLEDGE